MKRNNYLKIACSVSFISLFFFANAQGPLPCGPYKINKDALANALKFEQKESLQQPQSALELIRVYFHICELDDGSNPSISQAQLIAELDTLVSSYSADNICFLNAGMNYINNSFLDTNYNADIDTPADNYFNSYQVPNCINIFYMQKIKGKNPSCGGNCGYGGIALGGIPGTYCLVSSGNIGQGETISHEVGHCLGLFHTFENFSGTKYEDIDGSNSSAAGDMIVDTKADPYAYNANSCYATSSNGCIYKGSCTDPKGASNFSPPYSNLMAYWWTSGCYTPLQVTSNQYSRVNSFLFTYLPLEGCESPSTETLSNVNVSSGYYMQSAISNLTTSNSVVISGTANATLGGSLITLEPGFNASPSAGGLVLVRPEACGVLPSSLVADNNNNLPDKNKTNSLFVYPNPTSSAANLVFSIQHDENYALIKVYDMNLKIVRELTLSSVAAGKHTVSLNLDNLSSGVYSVTLQLAHSLMKTRVILTK